jgi:Ca2+-binding EF-hand superfamily protein
MKIFITTTASVTLALSCSLAQATDTAPETARSRPAQMMSGKQYEVFRDLDRGNTGRISRGDAERVPELAQEFERLDRDNDGFLSAEEFRWWDGVNEKANQ